MTPENGDINFGGCWCQVTWWGWMGRRVLLRSYSNYTDCHPTHRLGFVKYRALMLCLKAVALHLFIVTWWSGSGGIEAWFQRPTGFLQFFDAVCRVIWPVKSDPEMTYKVPSGTLNLYSFISTTHYSFSKPDWLHCTTGILVLCSWVKVS